MKSTDQNTLGSISGQSHFLTNPIPAKPLSFNLALDDGSHDEEYGVHSRYTHNYYLDDGDSTTRAEAKDSDARLMEMLAAQAAHREVESVGVDEDDIATDDKMSYEEKRDVLQRSLNMAASNGDVERVRKLVGGKARQYVDVNTPDEEGTVPLIYASCFVRGNPLLLFVPRAMERMRELLVSARSVLVLSRLTKGMILLSPLNNNRDIKKWFPHCSRLVRMSTNKTETGGARSCGR